MLICRDGKFPTRHSRHFPIPHSWLSSCGKIKIPHSRLRRSWGIFISSRLLSHSWGSRNVPFVIHEEFIFSSFVASRLMRKKPHPISFQTGYGSFPHFWPLFTPKSKSRPWLIYAQKMRMNFIRNFWKSKKKCEWTSSAFFYYASCKHLSIHTVVLISDQTRIHYLAVVFTFVKIQKVLIYVLKDLKICRKFQH